MTLYPRAKREVLTDLIKALGFDPNQTKSVEVDPRGWRVEVYVCDKQGRFMLFDDEALTTWLSGVWVG